MPVWPVTRDDSNSYPPFLDDVMHWIAAYPEAMRKMLMELQRRAGADDIGGGISNGMCSQQSTPAMSVRVAACQFYKNGVLYRLAAPTTSPTMSAPSTNPRIDLVTLSAAGAVEVVNGAEAASPSAPACPAGKLPLWYIWHRPGSTRILDTDDGVNSYLYQDARSFLVVPAGGGGSGVSLLDRREPPLSGIAQMYFEQAAANPWTHDFPSPGVAYEVCEVTVTYASDNGGSGNVVLTQLTGDANYETKLRDYSGSFFSDDDHFRITLHPLPGEHWLFKASDQLRVYSSAVNSVAAGILVTYYPIETERLTIYEETYLNNTGSPVDHTLNPIPSGIGAYRLAGYYLHFSTNAIGLSELYLERRGPNSRDDYILDRLTYFDVRDIVGWLDDDRLRTFVPDTRIAFVLKSMPNNLRVAVRALVLQDV